MNSLNTAAIYLLQTLGNLYLLVVLLRFLLQLVRADFYNPISQFIVRATKPLLMPVTQRRQLLTVLRLSQQSLRRK